MLFNSYWYWYWHWYWQWYCYWYCFVMLLLTVDAGADAYDATVEIMMLSTVLVVVPLLVLMCRITWDHT